MRHPHGLRAAANSLPPIGTALEGGFYAGLIDVNAAGIGTHLLIVAPAATGASGVGYTISTDLAIKTTATATAGTGSTFNGAANTAAMVTAGIALHPAANFCVNLDIGGFTDWYLPAILELDIAYFNLKPSTTLNNTGSGGTNQYAVPKRLSNWTTGNPTQTSVAAFQAGGEQAFRNDSFRGHWSSSEFAATSNWRHSFDNGQHNNNNSKEIAQHKTRAFRKVAL